jgi:hypothetical protein
MCFGVPTVFLIWQLGDGGLLGEYHLFVFIKVVVDGARHFFGDCFGVHVTILAVELGLLILLDRFLLLQLRLLFLFRLMLGLRLIGSDHYFGGILASSTALLTHPTLL